MTADQVHDAFRKFISPMILKLPYGQAIAALELIAEDCEERITAMKEDEEADDDE